MRRWSLAGGARAGALVFAAMLLASCAKTAPAPVGAAAAPAPAPALPPDNGEKPLRGNAVLGKDGIGIVPCGETAQRILEISPSAQPFLDKYLEGGAHQFFVEAQAEPAGDGKLRVLRFHRVYSEGPGCKAPLETMRFAAWGNEPFWAAVDAGDALRLERLGAEPLLAQPRSARQDGQDWVVEGQSSAGLLSLRLSPGFCSDGMTDSLYAWTATVSYGKEQIKGCGFRGSESAK
jgi:putative lipoprotein